MTSNEETYVCWNQRGQKRALEDEKGSNKKRSRHEKYDLQKDIIQLKTSSLCASPILNQAGSPDRRVRTKVNEFPAGNNATSFSHIAF